MEMEMEKTMVERDDKWTLDEKFWGTGGRGECPKYPEWETVKSIFFKYPFREYVRMQH